MQYPYRHLRDKCRRKVIDLRYCPLLLIFGCSGIEGRVVHAPILALELGRDSGDRTPHKGYELIPPENILAYALPGARYELDTESFPVQILNYSRGGLCIASSRASFVGAFVHLQVEITGSQTHSLFARVCWQGKRNEEYLCGCAITSDNALDVYRDLSNISAKTISPGMSN